MINQYVITYDLFACGGIGNVKLVKGGSGQEVFETEIDMLKGYIKMLKNNYYGNMEIFVTKYTKEKYNLGE